MNEKQVKAIDDVIKFLDKRGSSPRDSIKKELFKDWITDRGYILHAIAICEGIGWIIETNLRELVLTEKGTQVANMGYKEYDASRKSKSILESEYFKASITSYRERRKIMWITIIAGAVSVFINGLITLWIYLDSIPTA